jgi:periplasmic copper chaperone A
MRDVQAHTAMNAGVSPDRRRLCSVAAILLCGGLGTSSARAHGTRAGDLRIDHPYAIPTAPGARTGAVHFRTLVNRGASPDRLIGARTPLADSVEIHRSVMDGDVMRMRQIEAIEIPPGAELKLRHGGDTHLMLVGLKAPLQDGQRLPIWLRFERAGEHEVMVWVQTPRSPGGHRH